MDISEELLHKAIDSILHGSTQIITQTDEYGDVQTNTVRVNDLRQPLVDKLAEKLIQTDEFKKAVDNIFTKKTTQSIIDTILSSMKFEDLPWPVRSRLEDNIKNMDIKVKIRKYTLVADAIDEN